MALPISHPQTNLLLASCTLTNLMGHLSSCRAGPDPHVHAPDLHVHVHMGLDWLRLDMVGEIISGVIPTYPPSVPGAVEAHETSKNPAISELKTTLLYIRRAVVSH